MTWIELINLVLQAILGGSLFFIFQKNYWEQKNTQILANYSKILLYECINLSNSYSVLSNAILNLKNETIDLAIEKNLNNSMSTDDALLEALLIQYKYHNALPNIVASYTHIQSSKDQELWEKNLNKFISLPSQNFEILYRFFSKARPVTHIHLELNHLYNNKKQLEVVFSDYSHFAQVVETYLKFLCRNGDKTYMQHLLGPFSHHPFQNEFEQSFLDLKHKYEVVFDS